MAKVKPRTDAHLENIEALTSRYQLTPKTEDPNYSGVTRYTLWQRPNIVFASADAARHAVTPRTEYRPDLISYDYYDTVDYWWAIMDVNEIRDVFTELVRGTVVVVPPLGAIQSALAGST